MSKPGNPPSAGAPAAPRLGSRATAAIDDSELDELLGKALSGFGTVVLAVSGGADSMAMMHLAQRWAHAGLSRASDPRPRLIVATIDHGLRVEAAEEAAWVAARAADRGLEHHVLSWTGVKPETGRQDAARQARYRLLAGLAEQVGPPPVAIAVAHHLDDQAETLLMRLARGSGLDGLAGMADRRPLGPDSAVQLLRPLLGVPKKRLLATLHEAGIGWLDDPSNQLECFERVRLRRAAPILSEVGLANPRLALSARRLRRAQDALQRATEVLEASIADYHAGAYASLDLAGFAAAPEELRLRLLQRIVTRFGGAGEPPSMRKLERLLQRLPLSPVPSNHCPSPARGAMFAATLAGCQVTLTPGTLRFLREPGRRGLAQTVVAPGMRAAWDNRFEIVVRPACHAPVTVRALSPAELAAGSALAEAIRAAGIPRAAALTLPALWIGDTLRGVAGAAGSIPAEPDVFEVRFIPPG